jgi:hypothetical protein
MQPNTVVTSNVVAVVASGRSGSVQGHHCDDVCSTEGSTDSRLPRSTRLSNAPRAYGTSRSSTLMLGAG